MTVKILSGVAVAGPGEGSVLSWKWVGRQDRLLAVKMEGQVAKPVYQAASGFRQTQADFTAPVNNPIEGELFLVPPLLGSSARSG